jgi:phosphonate transport system substrate-binding protein
VLFAIPPTPSHATAAKNAPILERSLAQHTSDVTIEVSPTYGKLGDDLLSGRVQLAWAPPIVCARVEMGGGAVVLRAVRGGQTSYRAGLVCRAGANIDWSKAAELVAAWVDEDSAGGYLLARSWLKSKHIDAVHGFKRVLFSGNYVAALEAVADGRADIASIYVASAAAHGAKDPRSTLDEVDDDLKAKLEVFATTGETQTDGVVIAPGVKDEDSTPVIEALLELAGDSSGGAVLKKCLGCDELRRAPKKKTSSSLQDLIDLNEWERVRR